MKAHVSRSISMHLMLCVAGSKKLCPRLRCLQQQSGSTEVNPSQRVILDYDYTFTTPYSGSETIEQNAGKHEKEGGRFELSWKDCDERIDLVALTAKEPILFYDEVVVYENELADIGVSLLTAKVRVMPSRWLLLLHFWLRVDGVLM